MMDSTYAQTAAPRTGPAEDDAVAGIAEGLALLAEQVHPLGNVARAFKELLVERARLTADLKGLHAERIPAPDPTRFERGAPVSSPQDLIDTLDDTLWATAAKRLVPVMQNSFTKVGVELETIGRELLEGRLNPGKVLKASLTGRGEENAEAASRLDVSPHALAFALGQLAKPLIEKLSSALGPLIENLSWTRGYCPICGTMPELAFLQGEGGQRWLRCASCAHEWRFTRLVCPFCESDSHEDFEIYYVKGREYESVEVCLKCRRYVPTIDFRSWPMPMARDVAAMALMPLDLIAQQRGFLPAAVGAWNIVGEKS